MSKGCSREFYQGETDCAVDTDGLKPIELSRGLIACEACVPDIVDLLEERSGTDPLTKIGNLHRLQDRFDLFIAEYDRGLITAIGATMIDLVNFGIVNKWEERKHDAGNDILIAIAARIPSRPLDVVARIGGDEFAILSNLTPNPRSKNPKLPEMRQAAITKRALRAIENTPEVLDFNQRHRDRFIEEGEEELGARGNYSILMSKEDTLKDLLRRADPPKVKKVMR